MWSWHTKAQQLAAFLDSRLRIFVGYRDSRQPGSSDFCAKVCAPGGQPPGPARWPGVSSQIHFRVAVRRVQTGMTQVSRACHACLWRRGIFRNQLATASRFQRWLPGLLAPRFYSPHGIYGGDSLRFSVVLTLMGQLRRLHTASGSGAVLGHFPADLGLSLRLGHCNQSEVEILSEA